MKHFRFYLLALGAFWVTTPVLHAAITSSGSVADADNYSGSDPNTWNAATIGYIALDSNGQIDVTPSSTLLSDSAYLGLSPGLTGTVNIDGAGSAWTTSSVLSVGQYGTGVLNILNGGAVTTGGSVPIGDQDGSTGTTIVNASSLTVTAGRLTAGDYGTGTLEIRNGATVSSPQGRIGYHGSSNGTAIISGSNSTWSNTGDFVVGAGGSTVGTLTIEAGGKLTNTAGNIAYYEQASGTTQSGTVTVTGAGSQWINSSYLLVGRAGEGSLTVSDGAVVSNAAGYIGYAATGIGSATVSGTGSQWINNEDFLLVGRAGEGSLLVENGGVVSSVAGYLGVYGLSSGVATVTGTGSQWNNSSDLYVARDANATGSLTVSNGGTVTCLSGHIGRNADSSGEVTVTGSGSSLVASNYQFVVGNEGTGILNIYDSADVDVRDIYVNLNKSAGSSGTINFDNGSLHASTLYADFADLTGSGTIYTNGLVANTALVLDSTTGLTTTISGVGANGNITIELDASTGVPYSMGAGYNGVGSLTITDGVVLASLEGDIGFWKNSSGTATVSGNGTAWMIENEFDVGRYGAATLEISDGGLVAVDGILRIDRDVIDGSADAVADSFINMSDGGMLAVLTEAPAEGETLDPTTLIEGDYTHVQWWNETISDWASLTTATPGTDYTIEYVTEGDLAGYALLTVGESTPEHIAGDANDDGKVDGSDVTILAGNWQYGVTGGGATWDMGDFNSDGKVDGSDVTILAGNWQYGVDATAASVPEPSTLAILIILLLTGASRRKRS